MEIQSSLVVFTHSYPYDLEAEQTFLDPEFHHLARAFNQVIVAPAVRGGSRSALPPGVQVDETLAAVCGSAGGRFARIAATIRSPLFGRELFSSRLPLTSFVAARRLVAFVTQAQRVAAWLPSFVRTRGLEGRMTILYTYWLDHVTGGLAMARNPHRTRLVSRTHGYDLYEERQTPPYLPCRSALLRGLDCVYPISEHGRSYLLGRCPREHRRLEVSRLGTRAPGFSAKPSADGVLRVVSCSNLVPVKRVDELVRGLALAARARPAAALEWRHLGDGPLREPLERLAHSLTPPNLRFHFAGQVPNSAVLRLYREQPIDLFANVSESEGIPVSIMEAQSCRIPAMAPAVGGIAELVSSDNGFLLDAPASAEAIAQVILRILDTPGDLSSRRERSFASWAAGFDADRNFPAFCDDLRALWTTTGIAAA